MIPDYWKEPVPTRMGLVGWTVIIAAIAIPLRLIWLAFQ